MTRPAMLAAILACFAMSAGVMGLDFSWPSNTAACGVYDLTITGGSPPYSFAIVPLDDTPMMWTLNLPNSGKWINESYPVQVQFPAGTPYVVYMSTGAGFGQGGVTPIQIVGTGTQTFCLSTASQNQSLAQFNFQLYGTPTECDSNNLRMTWDGAAVGGPYNYTMIPLDGAYKPWTVPITGSSNQVDIRVNATAGSRFTVMMNNKFGYGSAKVGEVYQVGNTTSSIGCESQPYVPAPGFTWPSSLKAASLPALSAATGTAGTATASGTAMPSQTLNNNDGRVTFSLSTGAIAGIAVAGGVIIIGLGVLIWWLIRRKKRGAQAYHKGGDLDIVGEEEEKGPAPKLEPFRSTSDFTGSAQPLSMHAAPSPLGAPGQAPSDSQSQSQGSAAALFPHPQPTGLGAGLYSRSADGMSESGTTNTQYYAVAGHTGLTSPSSPQTGYDLQSQSGDGAGNMHQVQPFGSSSASSSGSPPPAASPMLLGPVSAAHEKARLSQQYAQMDLAARSPGAGPSSPLPTGAPIPTPATPWGPNHPSSSAFQPHPQGGQARGSAMFAQPQQGQIGMMSPSESSSPGGGAGSPPLESASASGGAPGMFRRHTDAGAMEEENRAPEGIVDLPPMYEDVRR